MRTLFIGSVQPTVCPCAFENNTTLSYWLNLVTTTPVLGKRAHDARIAALMQSHGITELLTLNEQDFLGMTGIVTLHPAVVK